MSKSMPADPNDLSAFMGQMPDKDKLEKTDDEMPTLPEDAVVDQGIPNWVKAAVAGVAVVLVGAIAAKAGNDKRKEQDTYKPPEGGSWKGFFGKKGREAEHSIEDAARATKGKFEDAGDKLRGKGEEVRDRTQHRHDTESLLDKAGNKAQEAKHVAGSKAQEAKAKTVEVARDLKGKAEDVASDVRRKLGDTSQDLKNVQEEHRRNLGFGY